MCVKSEHPVPKQLLPLNELKEHVRSTESMFLIRDTMTGTSLGCHDLSEMVLIDIDKYCIDFPEEAVEVIKSNMK